MKTRAYFFGNMYLSSIQQGIQAGHVIGEMATKYCPGPDGYTAQGEMFYHWAREDKVMILLNAGYGENIMELNAIFEGTEDPMPFGQWPYDDGVNWDESPYPFSMFSESDEALCGAATSFGIIIPAKIYNGAQAMRKIKRLRRDDWARMNWDNQKILTVDLDEGEPPEDIAYDAFEVELMERLGTFRLAQ